MNYIKNAILIAIVFVLVFLDISFFSFMEVYGATILSSLIFLIIFTITDKTKKDYLILALAAVLFFSIFSSLPLFIICIGFFAIPAAIAYIRQHYLPEPSLFLSIIYFLLAGLLFEGILMLYAKAWNINGLLTLSWFVFLNTVVGFFVYSFYLRIRKKLTTGEIKL